MEPAFYKEMFESEDWDWWHVGRRRVLARVLDRGLRAAGLPRTGASVLDVGCGTGGTTAYLTRGHRVTGCELEQQALRFCRRRGIERLVRASVERLPFRDECFDAALCLDVLEHHEDDVAVASEARRVLKPGGLLLATVPCFQFLWGPHDVLSHHLRRYSLRAFRDVMRRAGFAILRAGYFDTVLFPAAAAVQLARRVLRGSRPVRPASDLPHSMPRALNALLRGAFSAEAHVVGRVGLPFGISAFALGQA